MRYPRSFHLLVATLALQLSIMAPLWAQTEVSFTRQDFVVGGNAGQVSVGDFNGDSQQDLAIANEGVAILVGNGDGAFSRISPDPAIPDPEFGFVRPTRVTAGDFNGDGQQDLATAANHFNRVSILLGQGDGTFEHAQNLVLVDPASITVADFNGDGQPDLATANEIPSSVSILLGQGDGTFEAPRDLAVGLGPISITVADFDGDGRQDLATANWGFNTGATMSILLGQGDGSFEPAQTFAIGQVATSVTVGDFNSDGRPDLATTIDAQSVSILLGRGDGTFEPGQVFEPGVRPAFPDSITVGDFNGDGQQDLATANGEPETLSVMLGNGDGTFEPSQDFGRGMRGSVTVGDFNGDGRQDLVTAFSRRTQLLNVVGVVSILINIAPVDVTTYRLTRIGDEVTCAAAVASCFPTITDINNGAEMVGTTKSLAGEPGRAILLSGGMVVELGDLMGGAAPNAGATAINDYAQITGTNQIRDASGNLVTRGFFWEDGQMRDLGVDGDATPLDINELRPSADLPEPQIVGQAVVDNVGMPFLWEAGRTTLLDALVCLGNPGGSARAINNHGIIVGSSNSPAGPRAVRWSNGGMGGITPLEPPFSLEVGEAVDVNDENDVIGFYFNRSAPQVVTALLWQGNAVTVLLPLDRAQAHGARPESINDRRQIVGSTHFGSGQSLATLWQNGGAALDLNELVSDDDPAKAFVTLISAVVINDYGLIVVRGEDSRVPVGQEGRDAYYLMTPTGILASSAAIPSPSAPSPPPSDNGGGAVDLSSLLLLLIGLSASTACARRRRRR